jgi:hypothetical protein
LDQPPGHLHQQKQQYDTSSKESHLPGTEPTFKNCLRRTNCNAEYIRKENEQKRLFGILQAI